MRRLRFTRPAVVLVMALGLLPMAARAAAVSKASAVPSVLDLSRL